MAGYSGTPLARKLGIKAGARVLADGAPADFVEALRPLPEGVRVLQRAAGPLDVVVLFAADRARLQRRFRALMSRLRANGGLWVAWPKRSSGVMTDLSDGVVRAHGLDAGLVDNKVCAIDDTWSALRFVVRVADRAEWPHPAG